MLTVTKKIPPSHDENFVKFLQKSFGTTSVPFFGAVLSTVALVLIALIFLMYSTIVLITNNSHNNGNDSAIGTQEICHRVQLEKPLVV